MALQLIAGPVIAAGEWLSAAVDCSAGNIVRLMMPPAWTAANLTFQVSSDGTTFADVYSVDGREVMIPVVAGSTIVVDVNTAALQMGGTPPDLRGATWLKLRSGPASHPVPQAAERSFAITLQI